MLRPAEAHTHVHGNHTQIHKFTHSEPRKSQAHRNIACAQTRVHRHATDSEAGASTRARTHTYPPTHKQGLGWGGSLLILHKAGPLRGAPRHRGPLLTKPPAGSKSDPPSRLQRGQGTRLPCPPPPPRSAPLLRSGRGRDSPAAAPGISQPLPRARTGPPVPERAAPLWRPKSRRHSQPRRGVLQPDASACAPNAGARPSGCQAQGARESGARSCRPFTVQRQSPPCPV